MDDACGASGCANRADVGIEIRVRSVAGVDSFSVCMPHLSALLRQMADTNDEAETRARRVMQRRRQRHEP